MLHHCFLHQFLRDTVSIKASQYRIDKTTGTIHYKDSNVKKKVLKPDSSNNNSTEQHHTHLGRKGYNFGYKKETFTSLSHESSTINPTANGR